MKYKNFRRSPKSVPTKLNPFGLIPIADGETSLYLVIY